MTTESCTKDIGYGLSPTITTTTTRLPLSRSKQPYPTEEEEEEEEDEKSFQINPKKSFEKSPPATEAAEAPLWACMDSMFK